jgi:hypothetical protein
MYHHRRVHPIKTAAFQQQHFAGRIPYLFRRSPDYSDGYSQIVCDPGQGDSRSDCHCRNEVMAACMTNLGQAIVFCTDSDMQWSASSARYEGRREVADSRHHLEAG